MIIISIISIIFLIILIGWTWNNLDDVDKKLKILYIIVGIVIEYLITLVIFNISKSSVNYPNIQMSYDVRNVIIFLFTPLNGLIMMPYIAKLLGKIKYNEIEQDEFKTKFIIAMIIFLIILFIENIYLKNVQNGILDIVKTLQNK